MRAQSHRLPHLLAPAAILSGLAFALSRPHVVERELWLARSTGWIAAILLLVSLAVRRTRRPFGLWAAATAALHASASLLTPLVADPIVLIYEPHLRAGATALLVLALLAATSWPALVKGLKIRQWKVLHRAVYGAALLLFHHVWLSSHASRIGVVGLGSAVLLLLLLRVGRFAMKRDPSPAPPPYSSSD